MFKPSPLYLVRLGNDHVEWAFIPNVEQRQILLADTLPEVSDLLLRTLESTPRKGSTRHLLGQALALYTGSGDAGLAHDEFLGMWQAIEVLSLEKDGNTSKIASNVGNLWSDGHSSIRQELLALAPFRNKLVHVGQFNSERQSANYLLSGIVRQTLIRFAQVCSELQTTKDVTHLMSMMTLPPRSLPKSGKAVMMARKMRGISQ